jgi:arsenate reductase
MNAACDVIIYHNPDCSTSRNTLALIRNSGIEPHVIEYLKCPPARLLLAQLLNRAGLTIREVLREKGTPYHDLNLGDPALSDDALLDAIGAHPILMNRPLVVTPNGVRLCRPFEQVLDLLPPQHGEFFSKKMASGSLMKTGGAWQRRDLFSHQTPRS